MVDSVVVVTLLAVLGGVFLLFRREAGAESWKGERVVSVAMYFLATFLGTYGSVVLATILVLPILTYGRLAHSATALDILSAAVDRPYFPLQSAVAFAVGFALALRLKQGKPMWVWVWPVAQVIISVALHNPHSVVQSFTTSVWRNYFNWNCGCSATLLQWQVMSAFYTAIAFTLGVLARYGFKKQRNAPLSQTESVGL
jgi:hypothetical protein